jgi:HEPN domain-containing protein
MKSKADYVRDWIRKAASDSKIARGEMATAEPAADAVCFHFQQAAEKWLKAWLNWAEVAFRPTHNIEVLLAACEQDDPSFAALREAEALTPYAVEIRYADDFYMPTQMEMERASTLADRVERFVSAKLRAAGLAPPAGRH